MLTQSDPEVTKCYNPATGEEIGRSKLHSIDDLKLFISNAKKAQLAWSSLSINQRVDRVIKIRDYIINNSAKISEVISSDNGKTKVDALATEVLPAAMAVSYYCKNAKSFLKDKNLSAGNLFLIYKRSKIVRIPYGVVGIISPWNYPLAIPFSEVITALLCGNGVILKTATETQLVGLLIKEMIEYAELPKDLFNFINLPGKVAGDAFIENGIDKIFFIGSVQTGKYLLEKAAKTLTPVSLELGGNDAMIVCDDANLYRAANGALWGGFQNSGQSCGGIERIYVHEKIYDQFLLLLKGRVENLNVEIGNDFNSDMGCMTTERQVETVTHHIKDALDKGAVIYAQSKIPSGKKYKNFLPGMIITNVNHNMLLMKDETFGPVVGVMKFIDNGEAVRLANDSYLGLTGSVWSRNQKKAEEIARKIQAGVVTINDHLMSHGMAETPWGGFKQSGWGRSHGKFGFDEMTQPIVIVKDLLSFTKKQLWWHPYNQKVYEGIEGLLNLLYNKSPFQRIINFKKVLSIIPRIFKK